MDEREKQALVTALRLLAASPKSRKSLYQKLSERGFPEESLKSVVDRLETQGLLNDRVLAQSLFQSFLSYRPSGRRKIAFEMKKRGIDPSLIQELLKKYSVEEERQKALDLAKDKQQRWMKLEAIKRRKKIYDFLVRKGFDFSIAREAVEGANRSL